MPRTPPKLLYTAHEWAQVPLHERIEAGGRRFTYIDHAPTDEEFARGVRGRRVLYEVVLTEEQQTG